MQALLKGRLSQPGYVVLLSNLHAIYNALETALQQVAPSAAQQVLHTLVPAVLFRAPCLEQDLLFLHGPAWQQQLPLASAAQSYAVHLRTLGRERPRLLAAHAYVRYLGDLNGGQMLARLVGQSLRLDALAGLTFYRFDGASTVPELKAHFRLTLDSMALGAVEDDALVLEACAAFERHQVLFEELLFLMPGPAPGPGLSSR